MNEELVQGAEAASAAPAGPTAGEMLRDAREAAGLHVAALAVALKVPVRKLEALEAGQFDLLPDAVFVRALAASVCRTLKIDPAPVLAKLPHNGIPRLADTQSGINAPFRSPGDGSRPSLPDQLSRPVFLVVFALLLGALVLILLPATHRDDGALAKGEPVPVPAPAQVPMVYQPPAETAPASGAGVATVAEPGAAASTGAASQPAPAAMVVTVPAATARNATLTVARPVPGTSVVAAGTTVTRSVGPSVMATSTESAKIAVPARAPASAAASPASATAATPPIAAGGLVVFKAKRDSWVQVTDAKGVVTLRKLLHPGETASASGATPLVVTVGSANGTEVEVRGKAMDISSYARDNVARFEVK